MFVLSACVPPWRLISVLVLSVMTGDYRDLTPEQLRQELVARDARIIQLQNANDDERRAREELQSAVNYLYEQQVYAFLLERRQLRLCFATCTAQAHAFAGGV